MIEGNELLRTYISKHFHYEFALGLLRMIYNSKVGQRADLSL